MMIYLIGPMGSGKTTIGKILSSRLKYQFFDTDEEIKKKIGMSISSIFDKPVSYTHLTLPTILLV